MQEILKYTERAGLDATDLRKAVEVMRVVPKAANDMMNVGRLQGFEVRFILCFDDVIYVHCILKKTKPFSGFVFEDTVWINSICGTLSARTEEIV